jgi:hypothetical protein
MTVLIKEKPIVLLAFLSKRSRSFVTGAARCITTGRTLRLAAEWNGEIAGAIILSENRSSAISWVEKVIITHPAVVPYIFRWNTWSPPLAILSGKGAVGRKEDYLTPESFRPERMARIHILPCGTKRNFLTLPGPVVSC